MNKNGFVINNQQWFIRHKTKPNETYCSRVYINLFDFLLSQISHEVIVCGGVGIYKNT